MTGFIVWEALSDYGYVFLSLAGSIVVLFIVYQERRRGKKK